jgi:DNA-binding response OmpR family regulator
LTTNQPLHEILLLDDDEDDYVMLKAMLAVNFHDKVKLDWYQKDGVSNDMICSGTYAVTLVDLRLGYEDGLFVIKKAKDQCSEQVVFLYTGWVQEDIEQKAKEVGANGVIQKHLLSPELLKNLLIPYLPGLK